MSYKLTVLRKVQRSVWDRRADGLSLVLEEEEGVLDANGEYSSLYSTLSRPILCWWTGRHTQLPTRTWISELWDTEVCQIFLFFAKHPACSLLFPVLISCFLCCCYLFVFPWSQSCSVVFLCSLQLQET